MENRDCYGSIRLGKGKISHENSRTARKFKNRTLKTEGRGTQNRPRGLRLRHPSEVAEVYSSLRMVWAMVRTASRSRSVSVVGGGDGMDVARCGAAADAP